MPLAVGGAFHTPLLAPAVETLRPVLAETGFGTPSAPIVDNTDAEVRRVGHAWPELLARHLVEAVRWREAQQALVAELGATEVVELAPAGTLTAMAKRTIPDVTIRSLDDLLHEVRC
jgi:[acyl-carrier-protein] S-malonyltransferase